MKYKEGISALQAMVGHKIKKIEGLNSDSEVVKIYILKKNVHAHSIMNKLAVKKYIWMIMSQMILLMVLYYQQMKKLMKETDIHGHFTK